MKKFPTATKPVIHRDSNFISELNNKSQKSNYMIGSEGYTPRVWSEGLTEKPLGRAGNAVTHYELLRSSTSFELRSGINILDVYKTRTVKVPVSLLLHAFYTTCNYLKIRALSIILKLKYRVSHTDR